MSRHELFDVEGLPPPSGFSYGALSGGGRHLHMAGLTGHAADGSIPDDLVEQFRSACEAVALVVAEAGGHPTDVVALTIYVTDVPEYRSRLSDLGEAYRSVFDSHYPPMALLGIDELFDARARVELVGVAIVPD